MQLEKNAPEKIALFVDVQNVYYTCRQSFGRQFDYSAFWTQATAHRQVVAAYAYAIDRGDEKQRQFQYKLQSLGFRLRLKPFIQRADGTAKGDWDVGITCVSVQCYKAENPSHEREISELLKYHKINTLKYSSPCPGRINRI